MAAQDHESMGPYNTLLICLAGACVVIFLAGVAAAGARRRAKGDSKELGKKPFFAFIIMEG